MKKYELKKLVHKQEEKIEDSKIIPNGIQIALSIGRRIRRSEDWASESYLFRDDQIIIDYRKSSIGNIELKISGLEESPPLELFYAKELTGITPETSIPCVVENNERNFEIHKYLPGKWEEHIEEIYKNINEEITLEQASEVIERLGLEIKLN